MRLTTSQMFMRPTAQMSLLTQAADKLQTQIATTKRLSTPSDDASGYARLAGLRRAMASDEAYSANVKLAQGVLAQADGTLESVETQLQRAGELAIQAATDTLSPSQKADIATAIDGILEDLLALANTKDARGQPLFGGGTGDSAFVRNADGSVSYAGGTSPGSVPIGEGASVQVGEDGTRIFGGNGEGVDIFATLAALSAALKSGDDTTAIAGDSGEAIAAGIEQVSSARAAVGARAFRLDLEAERLADVGVAQEEQRSAIEDTDVTAAITELQKTLTVLQATQASFTKLSSLSLFDYLR